MLSITLFRAFSQAFGFRRATILENNIVQTTGSAGESIAFGVGVTMPALLLLGFEMDWIRVMTVSVLGGLLGILMMIPLRRAFIVKQHGKLHLSGGHRLRRGAGRRRERRGDGARWSSSASASPSSTSSSPRRASSGPTSRMQNLYQASNGVKRGLPGAAISGELAPELLGVGYLIGPRIASLMMAGAVLSYFVLGPLIADVRRQASTVPVAAGGDNDETRQGHGLIRNMGPSDIHRQLPALHRRRRGRGRRHHQHVAGPCR